MNVPVLGALFRSRDYQRQETELLISVTPYIARPTAQASLPRPGDGFADATDPEAVLLGLFNRVYGGPATLPVDRYRGRAAFVVD
jgi:pilus assembly protein CpaC